MTRGSVLASNIAGSLVIKGLAMLVAFATTSAYLRFFDNNAALGSWFTIVAILNWVMVFDVGVGNGLRNRLIEASAHYDVMLRKRLISSSYAMLCFPCMILALAGIVFIPILDWNSVLGVSSSLISPVTLRLSVSIVMGGVVLQFWLKLVVSILYSEQKTALANSLTLITSIGMLLFVQFFKVEGLDNKLLAISIVQAILLNLPTLIATIVVFSTSMRDSRPSLMFVDMSSAKSVMGLGLTFFIIQIFLLAANSTNELLIGMFYSSEDVVEYQIYYRLFFTLVSIFTIFVQPMWSALAQAYEEGNIVWMKKIYGKYNLVSLAGVVIALLFLVFLKQIIDIWIGESSIIVSVPCAATLALWASITMFVNSSTCVSNAVSRLKCQVIFCGLAAILKIPVSYVLSQIIDSWSAVVIANCIVLMPLLLAQLFDVNRFFTKQSFTKAKEPTGDLCL